MSDEIPNVRIVPSAKAVAEKILRAQTGGLGKVIFLIGAGCSVTAGIPSAPEIARIMVTDVATQLSLPLEGGDAAAAYRALVANDLLADAGGGVALPDQTDSRIDWYSVYDRMFERHYCSRDETRDLFVKIFEGTDGAINWAHLCLGELAARGLVSTVLTTNFDQLVLSGMVRAGALPVICDGIESLNRIAATPRHVQLIELHGSRHTYMLRNRPDDVKQFGENAVAAGAIQGLIQHAMAFVVVGYAGREKGVMDLLIRAARVFDDKNLFWVQRSANVSDLSPQARDFLATTRNGGLLLDQDADLFFLELCKALGVGTPSALSDPLKGLKKTIEDVGNSRIASEDIRREIAVASSSLDAARSAITESLGRRSSADLIRELRLAGKLREAYLLAEEALSLMKPLSEIEPILLEEAALAALEYGKIDADVIPLENSVARFEALAQRDDLDERTKSRAALGLAEALWRLGGRHPETKHLTRSIETLRAAESLVERGRAPLDWAGLQHQLGCALRLLGERDSETGLVCDAVTAFRAALEERTRERVPLDWATTHVHLGSALMTLGERERGTVCLEESVVAYRAALEELTRERVPLDWATTQTGLGSALRMLGDRERGTVRLEEAVVAYRAALEERTRERVPLQWAATQMSIGNALWTLGQRESGAARLEEAVSAYRATLEEWTRERVPLDWAMTQMNLGNALWTLGQREGGTARLEEAVCAYRAALEERTRERVPLNWAMTQMNLGVALTTLGERESGTARLEEAVCAYRAALEERTRERVPLDWAMAQMNLGNALRAIGERESGTACLEQAVSAYRAALEEWTRERVPLDWAMTQMNLGNALRAIGERESGTARLEEAVAAYRAALEELTRESVPLDWAGTQTNLGNALTRLGERESGTARLEEAVSAYRAALEEWTPEQHAYGHRRAEDNLALVLAEIERRRTSP